ncbi:MAG: exported protein of unknown function [Nitrosopumilales archaeon]|nr:MAG: exported protein of unknown function [Nitrosopumilales archaeon]
MMIILVAGMFVGSIPAYAGSAASSAIMQYEEGMISEAELEQRLRDVGYGEADIRQVKAVTGGLEHQQEDYIPVLQPITENTDTDTEKTSKVSADEADNIMLILGIGGAITVGAIAIVFSKRAMTS